MNDNDTTAREAFAALGGGTLCPDCQRVYVHGDSDDFVGDPRCPECWNAFYDNLHDRWAWADRMDDETDGPRVHRRRRRY